MSAKYSEAINCTMCNTVKIPVEGKRPWRIQGSNLIIESMNSFQQGARDPDLPYGICRDCEYEYSDEVQAEIAQEQAKLRDSFCHVHGR